MYNCEKQSEMLENRVITPESLWDSFDNNKMLELSKDLLLFKKQSRNSSFPSFLENEQSSFSNDMLTDFPEMALRRCVSRLFEGSSQEVPFTFFFNL